MLAKGRIGPRVTTVDGLSQLAFLVHGTLERRDPEHDLSIAQTCLLGILRDRTPTMNELDRSSVSGLFNRAERRGACDVSRRRRTGG
jgi:MarR family transcriptional regulator, lower aerobic nicotinate degradation pathway regulator